MRDGQLTTARRLVEVSLYKTKIPQVENFKYLGIIVGPRGIDWDVTFKPRN